MHGEDCDMCKGSGIIYQEELLKKLLSTYEYAVKKIKSHDVK